MEHLNILLVSTQDYIHHPIPSRHHYIFEEMSERHTIHVPHFHVSRGPVRTTNLHVHNATLVPVRNPMFHYTLNGPYHFAVMNRIIKEEAIDIVVASHILAGTAVISAAGRAGIPVVFDMKDWFPESAAEYYRNRIVKETIRRSVMALTRYNLDHSDRIITVSPSLVTMLESHGYQSDLITNGVDTGLFRPMEKGAAKDRLGIARKTFVIGFVGAVEAWFNLDEIIDAVSSLVRDDRDLLFLIVGGGLFTGYYQQIIKRVWREGLIRNVRFEGVVEYQDLPEYIAAMDVCTIPFRKWGEFALPNKFFEYSACGKPILMTPIPDVMKIGGENLFIYHNFEELMTFLLAFREIVREDPDTEQFKYQINLEEYSWKHRSRRFEEVFSQVLAGERTD